MSYKIISFEERMKAVKPVSMAIFGKSGVGKTSLLKTVSHKALLVDLEAGDLVLSDWKGGKFAVREYPMMRDLAAMIGGVNPVAKKGELFSKEHFEKAKENFGMGREELLGEYETIFIDSITVLSRLCLAWAEVQPELKAGDMRGAYGLLARDMMRMLSHIQHNPDKNIIFVGILDELQDDFNRVYYQPQMEGGKVAREISGILDLVLTMDNLKHVDKDNKETIHKVFYTNQMNEFGYPAKDRSGKLEPIEKADLSRVFSKIKNEVKK